MIVMKAATKFLCSLAMVAFIMAPASAQDEKDKDKDKKTRYEFVKTKAINKTYTVSGTDKLNITNSFGTVEVHTWNKNEIKVDVSIEVSSNTEAFAQKLIDGISVSNSQSGNEVSFKTSINGNNNSKNEKSNMSVDYSIYMPESNPLKLSNEFGSTVIPDMKGTVELTSKFGSLNTGTLTDVKRINVEFGSATIESMSNGTAHISYSKATLNRVSGNVKLDFDFCGGVKVNLADNLTGLELHSSYSTINLRPAANLSAAYVINTSFGSFKNKSGIKFDDDKDDSDGPKFDFRYEGKSGSGSVPIKINDSFGKIILGEASGDDMEDKPKNKRKTT
jgi:hypothetical protein